MSLRYPPVPLLLCVLQAPKLFGQFINTHSKVCSLYYMGFVCHAVMWVYRMLQRAEIAIYAAILHAPDTDPFQ